MLIKETQANKNQISADCINSALRGKWYHCKRIFIVKTRNEYRAIELNICERFKKAFIGNKRFFSSDPALKGAKILTPHKLNKIQKKTSDLLKGVIHSSAKIKSDQAGPSATQNAQPIASQLPSDFIQIIQTGIGYPTKLDLNALEGLAEKFRIYKSDLAKQKQYGNDNPDLVYLKMDDLANNLYGNESIVFLRYLILAGEIFAYAPSKSDFWLFVTEKAVNENWDICPPDYFDKKKLNKAYEYMKKLQSIPLVSEEAKTAVSGIKDAYFRRIDGETGAINDLGINAFSISTAELMDTFVKNQLIHSWNRTSRGVSVKLKAADKPTIGGHDPEWRDIGVVQRDEKFRKANYIDPSAIDISTLEPKTEKPLFDQLINVLNRRGKPGPMLWMARPCDIGEKIVQLLEDQEVIFDFKEVGNGSFKIYVKEEDRQ